MCFILPDLLFPGKVSLVIEPVVAIIINQVDAPDERDQSTCIKKSCGQYKYFIQHMMSPWQCFAPLNTCLVYHPLVDE